MEMPYKSLTSKKLSSLITIVRLTTVLGYVGLSISVVGFVLEIFSISLINTNMLAPSVLMLFFAGFFAILVSFEDAYRCNIEKDKPNG